MKPRLLVSVRNLSEAWAAVDGGAAVVDVKEPSRGALGRADPATLHTIVQALPQSICLSAALGELGECPLDQIAELPLTRLQFVKCGLAKQADWSTRLLRLRDHLAALAPDCQLVAVAYADTPPSVAEVAAFASEQRFPVLLIDTFYKDGRTLSDHLAWPCLTELVARLHREQIRVALAGSLGLADVSAVCQAAADYLAVRGAACVGRSRDAAIDATQVAQLSAALARWDHVGSA